MEPRSLLHHYPRHRPDRHLNCHLICYLIVPAVVRPVEKAKKAMKLTCPSRAEVATTETRLSGTGPRFCLAELSSTFRRAVGLPRSQRLVSLERSLLRVGGRSTGLFLLFCAVFFPAILTTTSHSKNSNRLFTNFFIRFNYNLASTPPAAAPCPIFLASFPKASSGTGSIGLKSWCAIQSARVGVRMLMRGVI